MQMDIHRICTRHLIFVSIDVNLLAIFLMKRTRITTNFFQPENYWRLTKNTETNILRTITCVARQACRYAIHIDMNEMLLISEASD